MSSLGHGLKNHRRIEIVAGKALRLMDVPAETPATLELLRVRGDFCVLKLEHSAPRLAKKDSEAVGEREANVSAGAPARDLRAAAESADRPLDAVAEHSPERRFTASDLDQKLWGGYSKYALPALEAIAADVDAAATEREKAAWGLTRWFYVHEDFARALRETEFSLSLQTRPRPRLMLVAHNASTT